MTDLDLSPDFEAALRSGLAGLAASAPVPDDSHLDALEQRAATSAPQPQRNRRPLALVAAIVLVVAGIFGALALRGGDEPERFDKVGDSIPVDTTSPGSSTTTSLVGPEMSAQFLGVTDGSGPAGEVEMDTAKDLASLTELWEAAGLDPRTIPPVDFSTTTVVAITVDDIGCRTDSLTFFRGATSVRAVATDRDPCPFAIGAPTQRTYFHGLQLGTENRPRTLEVVVPGDPDSIGSVPID